MAIAWTPAPSVLDILYCLFPYDHLLQPASEPHFVLVVDVDASSLPYKVYVCCGTSKKINSKYTGQFAILQNEGAPFKTSGCDVDTKFDLTEQQRMWLPYTDEFFYPKPSFPKRITPKVGRLDISYLPYKHRFKAAAEAAGLL